MISFVWRASYLGLNLGELPGALRKQGTYPRSHSKCLEGIWTLIFWLQVQHSTHNGLHWSQSPDPQSWRVLFLNMEATCPLGRLLWQLCRGWIGQGKRLEMGRADSSLLQQLRQKVMTAWMRGMIAWVEGGDSWETNCGDGGLTTDSNYG